jgi:hypothetical protein
MAEEKFCPLLKENCIRGRCKMWIQVTISGKDKEGKTVTKKPPEECALVWSGIAALKTMQFPAGTPVARRPAQRS